MTQSAPTFIHVNDLTAVAQRRPTFLAIGSFDGVHLGHQALIRQLVAAAREAHARAAVLTFFPHPKRVIQNLTDRYYLTTLEDRVALLADLGVELIITHPFNETVRQTRAETFVMQLCHYLEMRQLWGGNFALGYNREGDIPFLRMLGEKLGFEVRLAEQMVSWDGGLVSSSRVRHSLATGRIRDVTGCLARPFHMSGQIVVGDKRGRTIGFPTANLQVWEELLLPGNGVYAARAWVNGQSYAAATNIGVRPTVDGTKLRIEAHLLDFSGDIYGAEMRLDFLERVRPELRFDGLDALQAQISRDVEAVRAIYAREPLASLTLP
ncbi:MAG: bifunctional riboflavin kinase/FAD synthetase [Chloroflexota bacterium]